MDFFEIFNVEVIKALPKFLGTIIILAFGWIIGNRVTHYWNIKKTKQELDIAASKTFQSLYGDFFSIWKLWNYYRRDVGTENFPNDLWWQVMDRASVSEGKLEALLVNIACEKKLSKQDVETLGLFRQGYQQLRESIRDYEPLNWNSSTNKEYVKFKELSPKVANIILTNSGSTLVGNDTAAEQLKNITSNNWETEWIKLTNDN